MRSNSRRCVGETKAECANCGFELTRDRDQPGRGEQARRHRHGGARRRARGVAGTYTRGTSTPIVIATGGVSGTFGTVANAAPQFLFQPTYKSNEVDLFLAGFALATTLTGNEQSVFNALENVPIGSATDALLNVIGSMSGTAQATALNQLNSYSAASTMSVMTVGMSTFQDAMGGRASADPDMGAPVKTAQLVTDDWLPIPSNRYTVWSQGIGQFSTLHGTSSTPGQNSSVGGGVIGVDTALDPATRVGASFGATAGGVSVQKRRRRRGLPRVLRPVGLHGGAGIPRRLAASIPRYVVDRARILRGNALGGLLDDGTQCRSRCGAARSRFRLQGAGHQPDLLRAIRRHRVESRGRPHRSRRLRLLLVRPDQPFLGARDILCATIRGIVAHRRMRCADRGGERECGVRSSGYW